MAFDRRLNLAGVRIRAREANLLRKTGIYARPFLSLEHQGLAKRYVVRGIESGGATEELGHYVTFASTDGEPVERLGLLGRSRTGRQAGLLGRGIGQHQLGGLTTAKAAGQEHELLALGHRGLDVGATADDKLAAATGHGGDRGRPGAGVDDLDVQAVLLEVAAILGDEAHRLVGAERRDDHRHVG